MTSNSTVIKNTYGTNALKVINASASGAGAAVSVKSASTTGNLIEGQGAGPLLDLRNSSGVSKVTVSNAGNAVVAGTLGNTGDQTVTGGNTIVATAGKGLNIKEGSNARMGTGTLNGATEVTISTTAVTANSRIFLSIQAPAGTPAGVIYVSSRVAATSFGVKGAASDTSTFAWMIVEPSA
jgi:hypothetical protein